MISFGKTFVYTAFAVIAFAANSVLCRLALGENAVDAYSFTVVRLLSGSAVLWAMLKCSHTRQHLRPRGSWMASIMLFLYAVTFSFAYVTLDTGTGALILFGSVQVAIVLVSLFSGETFHSLEWVGLSLALVGFAYLVLPGVSAPSFIGFSLMTTAGIAWGIYTIIGKGSTNPVSDTAFNFTRTLPFVMALALCAFARQNVHLSQKGLLLALMSGGITSGIGYAVWYKALAGLSAAQSGVVQLFVPVVAAFGGIIFVSETISLRLFVSAAMILGGITVVFLGRYQLVGSNDDN